MAVLKLGAPMRGWAESLDEVDDPVFAGRMLGDGVAIDPVGAEVRAPCDGEVTSVHRAGHAVSLRAGCGAELLVHVGLETVSLGGRGFIRHVADGAAVKAGDLLISVDLEAVARTAKSLITPMVLTNGDEFEIVRRNIGRRVEVGDVVMEIRPLAETSSASPVKPETAARQVVIPLAHGLHARPSALIAAEAKRHVADIRLSHGGREANARSPVAIMALGLVRHDAVSVTASGAEAAGAVAAVADLIERGLPGEPPPPAPSLAQAPGPELPPADASVLEGTPAAPGLAIGSAVRLIARAPAVNEVSRGVAAESAALAEALSALRQRMSRQAATGPQAQTEIVRAHLAFLDDEDLAAAARDAIEAGASAGVAWRRAIEAQVAILRQVSDVHIAQRADDLVDLERQVLVELAGESEAPQVLPDHAVLLAEDLGPAQLIGLPKTLAGICTARGGPTSHVAILATAMNIPAVVAVGPAVMRVPDGAAVILDGGAGRLHVAPSASELSQAQTRLAVLHARRRETAALASEPCRMGDGTRIEVFANLGSVADAGAAMAAGAEGCGLLRTEFLFLGREGAPSENEQVETYQAIAKTLAGAPLVIRTLDVGGDKPVPFLDLPPEANPALGLRGVRVSLSRPELLSAQIRAILRVTPQNQCRILVPMVASLSELTAVRQAIAIARSELGHRDEIQVGVMIETPAAAVTADLLAAEADFLSIGTNDLTQYVLAMDRENPQLAGQTDALHPAVLRLIAATTRGARVHGRQVAVCGGLAADPAAAAILIGLGVTELSAPPAAIPELKAAVRALTFPPCEDLAARALECASAAEVRALMSSASGGER
ncbi:MAG TPA: phosphoenolpyruvate--protein phosphotransferase [Caulobacteraceae bacterium]|nr:phosphoenolpyruvate--protein phosphotransferase [Caulobacteraceae bacterium]